MFNIGDLIIYSAHGICQIDDICDETVAGVTKKYYKLHPYESNHHITIRTPVDNDKVLMLSMIPKEEVTDIMDAFKEPALEWDNNPNMRLQYFSDIINTGERKEIAKVVNTLMRKKIEVKLDGKNLYERDHKVLNSTQTILFKELSIALDTTFEEVNQLAIRLINENS
ncbi:CarD family transcriptional regulator [Planococcus sp. N028]|uniref:CarD family transcriptional regulator n=1 Tax=Planococcus shixiaomingii TaxID=3058393 RepID=A0ABT8N531_9BACL|nr:CarD family transcriptional regulator [Planococcus sp. N028]MDN7242994.1 CarD family transcriptional regulator [Planococcus sp. N028]